MAIWYISKYVVPPYAAKVGARGFFLLQEFVRKGHRAILITSDANHLASPPVLVGARFFETVDGVDVHWLRTLKYKHAGSWKRILGWFHFEQQLFCMPKAHLPRPDVVIVSSLSPLTILNGLLLRQRYRCRLVFELRDIWPLTLTEVGKVHAWHPFVLLLGWLERLGYERADLIVGTMPNLAEHVREVLGAERNVVCVPQGIDPALLAKPAPLPPSYAATHIPVGKFIVCYAGSIGANNALETLITCAREMTSRADIHFMIVGDGYHKDNLQKLAADLPNVTFAPRIPKAAVQSLLAHADLLYFATHKSPLLRFGQSLNKVIDYMLAGKPIVASYTGYPSMINEAECGSFIPAGNAGALRQEVERYAAITVEERVAMGQRGRAWLLQNRKYCSLADEYLQYLWK
jgi:glycosyltransferase involved in cell wall biosynthesis